jgi:hypothetical protein
VDWWRSFRDSIDETTSEIRWFLATLGLIGTIIVISWRWFLTLVIWQRIGIIVAVSCLGIIALTFVVDWLRKKNIEQIPDLLAKIDQLTLDYIDKYVPNDDSEETSIGLAKLTGIETGQFRAAVALKNKNKIDDEADRIFKQYEKSNRFKKVSENLQNLLYISAYLNANKVGLKQVTDTREYRRLYKRIKNLQRMVPSSETNMKINEYWQWSEGLYSMLLTFKPSILMPGLQELLPSKVVAGSAMMQTIFEEQTSVLISAVRESIIKYKERNLKLVTNSSDKK